MDTGNSLNQSKLEADARRGKVHANEKLVLLQRQSGANFLSQSFSAIIQNQSMFEWFETVKWKPLYIDSYLNMIFYHSIQGGLFKALVKVDTGLKPVL